MGDTSDGSSRAAQRAPEDDTSQDISQHPSYSGGALAFLNKIFGREAEVASNPTTENTGRAADHPAHQAMMLNLRNMRNVRVEDVAVPRADVIALPDSAILDEVVAVFDQSTFTRVPVYSETLDTPLGFVHLKDIALRYGFNGRVTDFDLSQTLRKLLYVPPSMPIGVLLQKMQTERVHMALVIDEYGGVDGLVTIEDLVEQIVGDIADEHDTEEDAAWVEEAPGVYLCTSRAPLEEFEPIAGVDLLPDDLDEDVDTIGGLVFMLAGRVPLRGEVIPHPQGHEFEVVDADPRMLKRVRVRLNRGERLDQAAQ